MTTCSKRKYNELGETSHGRRMQLQPFPCDSIRRSEKKHRGRQLKASGTDLLDTLIRIIYVYCLPYQR